MGETVANVCARGLFKLAKFGDGFEVGGLDDPLDVWRCCGYGLPPSSSLLKCNDSGPDEPMPAVKVNWKGFGLTPSGLPGIMPIVFVFIEVEYGVEIESGTVTCCCQLVMLSGECSSLFSYCIIICGTSSSGVLILGAEVT